MKKIGAIVLFILLIAPFAYCQSEKPGNPVKEPAKILKNLDEFLYYIGGNVNFYDNCIALDTNSNPIDKEAYLKALITGQYIPLRLTSRSPTIYYKLYRLHSATENKYGQDIKGWAQVAYDDFKREGKAFPTFNFVDLKGNIYNKETIKDKVIVLKCWFIACSTCETQRPAFNALVKKYRKHKDLLFISLADDPKSEVEIFLKSKQMDYMVIPNQLDFIKNNLNVNGYPTYFIINKEGAIARVVDTPDNVDYVLKSLL